MLAAGRNGAGIGLAHFGVLVLARETHAGEHIVHANKHHVDTFDRGDLLGLLDRLGRFELHDHHGSVIDGGVGLGGRKRAIFQMRQGAAGAAFTERGIFRGFDHLARLRRRSDAGRDDAERAAVQHALDVFGRVGGHAHHRHESYAQRRQANLPGRFERHGRMFQVDINHVEAGGLGQSCYFDAAREADRDRGDHLVARQLFFNRITQHFTCLHVCLLISDRAVRSPASHCCNSCRECPAPARP